jgi:hypothetical protein
MRLAPTCDRGRSVTNAAFEPVELLRVLCRHGVAFVAIGGFAAEVQGVSWSTLDLDIVIEKREENYAALAAALVDVDAWCLVPPGSIQRIRPDLELLRALTGTLMLRTRCGRLDIMKGSDSGAGGDSYSTLAPGRSRDESRRRHVLGRRAVGHSADEASRESSERP